jgi:hypothetical protein
MFKFVFKFISKGNLKRLDALTEGWLGKGGDLYSIGTAEVKHKNHMNCFSLYCTELGTSATSSGNSLFAT